MCIRDSLKQSVRICLSEKFFKLNGRAPRVEFWCFMLFSLLLNIALTLVDSLPILPIDIASIVSLVMFFPSLAVTVRRLHDLDRSGWYIAIPVGAVLVAALLLILGTTVFASAVVTYLGMSLMIAGLFIEFALLIYLIKKGTDGANRFGEDPLSQGSWA